MQATQRTRQLKYHHLATFTATVSRAAPWLQLMLTHFISLAAHRLRRAAVTASAMAKTVTNRHARNHPVTITTVRLPAVTAVVAVTRSLPIRPTRIQKTIADAGHPRDLRRRANIRLRVAGIVMTVQDLSTVMKNVTTTTTVTIATGIVVRGRDRSVRQFLLPRFPRTKRMRTRMNGLRKLLRLTWTLEARTMMSDRCQLEVCQDRKVDGTSK